jgi:hypothetical protein
MLGQGREQKRNEHNEMERQPMDEIKKVLTNDEWKQLYVHAVLSKNGLTIPKACNPLFDYLISRTLFYNKTDELFRPKWLLHGNPKHINPFPLMILRAALWKHKTQLIARNLVEFTYGKKVSDVQRFRINAYGIAHHRYTACTVGASVNEEYMKLANYALHVKSKLADFYDEHGWEKQEIILRSGLMVEMRDMIKSGKAVSKAAQERRHGRRMEAPPEKFKGSWVLPVMEEFCKAEGIRYFEQMMSAKNKGRIFKSADNFVRYCIETERDPRNVLLDVCHYWARFHKILKTAEGKFITLPSTVNFMDFFNNKNSILEWIERKKSGMESNVIQMRDGKKMTREEINADYKELHGLED